MRRLSLALLVLVLGTTPSPADRPAYTPEQLALVRSVTECRLSPDGNTVAFVSDITGALELWTVPAAGGWPSQLSNLGEQASDIRWSPDGRWIVFTSDYGGNERRDLYRVSAAGGAVEKLTDTKLSESEPRFSPDGKWLAFTADPDKEFDFQLHVMDLATRQVTRLTREPVKVQVPVWSPDSRTIAINRSGDDQKGDLLLVHVPTGAKEVVPPPSKDGILWPAAFSPDGGALLVLARNERGFVQPAVLKLAPGTNDKPASSLESLTFLGPDHWDASEAHWTKQGIAFLLNEDGANSLYCLRGPAEVAVKRLAAEGVAFQLSFDGTGQKLTLLRETVTRPADVWVADLDRLQTDAARERLTQVTRSLMGGVEPQELAAGEMIVYESFDKTKVHALLVKPRVLRLGSPPPAIVYVHGGPNGQSTRSFDPLVQLLAEAGFVVVAPNYRGSTGYGKAFEDANNKDWGGGDLKDLLGAVKYLAERKELDPKRVGITGGSYGGYMTLLALSRAPDVFAAGVESYGMCDLLMDYWLTKSRFGDWYETEMGDPRTGAALYRERSPLPYLENIRAPLLVFQGANDTNVPKSESDLLTAVLKQLGKAHEYIVYEDEGHGFSRRRNLIDFYKRTTTFFVERFQR